jgi:hypothetical protein
MESRVEGALFDVEKVVGGALNVEDDAVSMKLAHLSESFEDEKVECSL